MKNINSNSVALFKIISGKSVEEVASIYNVSNAFVCEAMDKFLNQANEKRKYYLNLAGSEVKKSDAADKNRILAVSRLALSGKTANEIAGMLGIEPLEVYQDIHEIEKFNPVYAYVINEKFSKNESNLDPTPKLPFRRG